MKDSNLTICFSNYLYPPYLLKSNCSIPLVNADHCLSSMEFGIGLYEPTFSIYCVFGICLFLLTKNFWKPTEKVMDNERELNIMETSSLKILLCFVFGYISLPVMLFFGITSVCYRYCVDKYLSYNHNDGYVGLLKGPDVLWAISAPEARSAVNVLAVIDVTSETEDILCLIRKISERTLLSKTSPFPKLLYCQRWSYWGYFYWIHPSHHKIDDYVRPFKNKYGSREIITQDQLQDMIADCCNNPFPINDSATWEVLVSEQKMKTKEGNVAYPILFRIHHSVGDGVALLRLLLEGLADKYEPTEEHIKDKREVWLEKPITEKVTTIVENSSKVCNEEVKTATFAQEIEPVITLSAKNNSICFRKNSLTEQIDSRLSPSTPIKEKKSPLAKIKNSFKLIRMSPVSDDEPIQTFMKETDSLSLRPYSPIKGLGYHKMITKIPVMRKLTKSSSTNNDKLRNTCVVYPQPREKESINVSRPSHENLSITKIPTPCLNSRKEVEKEVSKEVPESTFKKCNVKYNDEKKSGGKPTDNEIEKIEINNGDFENPSARDLLITIIISLILSFACIKNSLLSIASTCLEVSRSKLYFCFQIPYILISQSFATSEDVHLYGKALSGKKVVSWISENENLSSEETIRAKIRKIRQRIGGNTKFSDILMSCLSESFKNYYKKHKSSVPSNIKVVLPARINSEDLAKGLETTAIYHTANLNAKITRVYSTRRTMKAPFKWQKMSFNSSTESEPEEKRKEKVHRIHSAMTLPSKILRKVELENKFTVAVLKLPISSSHKENLEGYLNIIRSAQYQCRRLREAPDYMLNYWLLRWVAHMFPVPLLKPFLSGGPCTLVLSNVPGPEDAVYLYGNLIRDITFWVPNRGLNGVGIGMLSYCGRFSFGIIADTALISSKEEAKEIIRGIFDEVDKLYSYCDP